MMIDRRMCLLVSLGVMLAAGRALAVIGIKSPIPRVYAASSLVVVGKVVGVNAANGVIDAEVIEVVKGDLAGQRFRVQIREPREVIGQVKAEQKLVVFFGGRPPVASVHVGDRWLVGVALPAAAGPAWRTEMESPDLRLSYPGPTESLVRIIAQVKAGKSPLLDIVENRVFRGGTRAIARVNMDRPAFMLSLDVNGDRKPDLIVGSAGGVKLLLADGAGYVDSTEQWGLAPARGAFCAAGDVNGDGKGDLLIGRQLWLARDGRFAPAGQVDLPEEPLAVAIADANADQRFDILTLAAGGELTVLENGGDGTMWKPRAAVRLWPSSAEAPACACFGDWAGEGTPHVLVVGPAGLVRYALDGTMADFLRLTGEQLDLYKGRIPDGLRRAVATPIDIDGNGLMDCLVVSGAGGLLLVNRGFGAYRVVGDIGESLKRPPDGAVRCWSAADRRGQRFDDLLMLREDGTLFVAENPPYAIGQPK